MPTNETSEWKGLATRLLAYEAASDKRGSAAKKPTVFRVCEKLRSDLSKLVGIGGFCSLLSRALTMAGEENPGLRELQVKADGSLDGIEAFATTLDPDATAESEIALVSHFLGLLVIFIGPALTLQLLRDIWPKMDDLNF